MLLNPPERNVNPFLFPTGIRAMKELVLALTIHDQMLAWPSQHEFATLPGQDLQFHLKSAEVPKITETMSLGSPRSPNSGSSSLCHPACEDLPRQRFRFAAVWTAPSAHQGFIRGAIALHKLASSVQHRSPDCGPTAVPRPYAYEQEHEESGRPTKL